MADVNDFSSYLDRLAPKAKELQARFDQSSEAIKSLEAQLKEMRPGVEARLVLSHVPTSFVDEEELDQKDKPVERPAARITTLYYGKLGGGYAFGVQETIELYDSGFKDVTETIVKTGAMIPLLQAPRIVRLEALALMPRLLEELIKNVDEALAKSDAAKGKLAKKGGA